MPGVRTLTTNGTHWSSRTDTDWTVRLFSDMHGQRVVSSRDRAKVVGGDENRRARTATIDHVARHRPTQGGVSRVTEATCEDDTRWRNEDMAEMGFQKGEDNRRGGMMGAGVRWLDGRGHGRRQVEWEAGEGDASRGGVRGQRED
jgi:hypothetical protein